MGKSDSGRVDYRIPFKFASCRVCRFWVQDEGENEDSHWGLLHGIGPEWGHCLPTISEEDTTKQETKAWAGDYEGMFAVLQTHASFSCCQFQEEGKEDG